MIFRRGIDDVDSPEAAARGGCWRVEGLAAHTDGARFDPRGLALADFTLELDARPRSRPRLPPIDVLDE